MEELEKKLIELFNSNKLPFEAKRYVVKHFAMIVDNTYQMELLKSKEVQDGIRENKLAE